MLKKIIVIVGLFVILFYCFKSERAKPFPPLNSIEFSGVCMHVTDSVTNKQLDSYFFNYEKYRDEQLKSNVIPIKITKHENIKLEMNDELTFSLEDTANNTLIIFDRYLTKQEILGFLSKNSWLNEKTDFDNFRWKELNKYCLSLRKENYKEIYSLMKSHDQITSWSWMKKGE